MSDATFPAREEWDKGLQKKESCLGTLTAMLIDALIVTSSSPDIEEVRALPPNGPDGYRAQFLRYRAQKALEEPDRWGVAKVFSEWVRVADIVAADDARKRRGETPTLSESLAPLLADSMFPLSRFRRRGRPPGRTVITHVRVWTVECLRRLAGLTVAEALRAWGEWFPRYALNPNTLESTGRRTFYRDLQGVAQEIMQPKPEPPPRRRGRPRKHFSVASAFARLRR